MTSKIALKERGLHIETEYTPPEEYVEFVKNGMHRLSPHVSNWPVEILKVLGEEYPWVVEGMRPATVDLEKVDKGTGTGFGGIVIWTKRESPRTRGASSYQKQQQLPAGPTIIIPFMVRNFEMSPLDIFVSGKKVLPLTPKRVGEEMQSHQIFTGVDRSRVGDMSTLGNKLSPPPEAYYGQFGGGGGQGFGRYSAAGQRFAVKMAEAVAKMQDKAATATTTQDSYILQQIIPTLSASERISFSNTVHNSPAMLAQFTRNKNVDVLQKIIKARPLTASDIKNTERWAFPKNVLLFEKVSPGQWRVTTNNDYFPNGDVLHLSEKKLLEEFSDFKSVRNKLWNSNGFIVTVGHKEVNPVVWHDELHTDTTQIHSPGVWLAVSDNKQVMRGFAWTQLCDFHCNPQHYILWYDRYYFTMQERIQGEHLKNEEMEFAEDPLQEGTWGVWLHAHENGEKHPTLPFKIRSVYTRDGDYEGKVFVRASDIFGNDVTFMVCPGIEKMHSAAGILDARLAAELGANAFFVPSTTAFVTLGTQRIKMVEHAKELDHAFRDTALSSISLRRDKATPATTIIVTCTDRQSGEYRLEGNIIETLLRVNALDVKSLKAKWILVMHGCSVEKAQKILDQAHSMQRSHVYVMSLRPMKYGATIKTNEASEIVKVSMALRRDLIKEAAYIKDKNSVDALLSLNFVSPENLLVFLKNIEKFRDVEQLLAKLLLMARFGLEAIPESAVANALKNFNTVTEGLEQLQGVLGQKMSPEGEIELPDPVEKTKPKNKMPANADTTL